MNAFCLFSFLQISQSSNTGIPSVLSASVTVKCDVVEARDCSGRGDCSLQKLREAGFGLQISRMMLASFFPKSDVNESFDKPQSSKLCSRNRSVICIYRLLELDMKESQLWNRIVLLGRDLKLSPSPTA